MTEEFSRQLAALESLARAALESPGRLRSGVFRVVDGGSKPTTGPAYCLGYPVAISGDESVGAAISGAPGPAKVPVLILGPSIPPDDQDIPAVQVGGRWVSRYGAGTGGGPPPSMCACWPVGSIPDTLNWSAAWEAAETAFFGPWTGIGTKSGTLSRMPTVSYPDYTGSGVCYPLGLDPNPGLIPAPGVAGTGWIGPWTDFCFLPGTGGVSTGTPVSRPQCIAGNAFCASASGTMCRYLWFVCSAVGAFIGSPGGHAGLGFTYAGAPSGPGAGSGAIRCSGYQFPEYPDQYTLSCSPFFYQITVRVSSVLRFILTVTE